MSGASLAGSPVTAAPLAGRLRTMAATLRAHGVRVGTTEAVDAASVIDVLGMTDRDQLRAGLAAAFLRRSGDRQVFDDVFDLYFPAALGGRADAGLPEIDPALTPREKATVIRQALSKALATDDQKLITALVALAVEHLGKLPNESTMGSYSGLQARDLLNPQTAIAGAMDEARAMRGAGAGDGSGSGTGGGQEGGGGGSGGGTGGSVGQEFDEALLRDRMRTRAAEITQQINVEARRRNAELRGTERMAKYAVATPMEQKEFLLAGAKDLQELRAILGPLSRKLATRLAARQRRDDRGKIDIRRTLRSSMATGGVPLKPVFRKRKPHRPDLVILCDMSGSVAGFSSFTILLMQALAGSFRRMKVVGFVNSCADLTEIVTTSPLGADLKPRLAQVEGMTRWDSSSDYGSSLVSFVDQYLDFVTHRSTVLILGDARTNGTNPRVDQLHIIAEQARHVAWLNPEPSRSWGVGDSVTSVYGAVVGMHECRNVEQLRDFVTRLLPV
ncbi:VWA domain-containing protein [Kribbia dieselivorans]|uniref:VWA domain-containing protein n=1 Tax=Kribbia dieselivorans TaxID=331526 RepID=UPI0009FAF14A|nr:VWA domain-containing protein [Kribbia dieselivorans]